MLPLLSHRVMAISLAAAGALSATTAALADARANPWLADSPWPMTHRQPGAPDASPYPGPQSAAQLGEPQFAAAGLINITLAMSPKYPNGQRVYWGSNLTSVYKLAVVDGKLKNLASIAKPGNALSNLSSPTSGAYTLVDKDNVFYTVRGTSLLAYRDSVQGRLNSGIELARQLTLPASVASSDDAIVGLNLLWDGHLAFVTKKGVAGVVKRDFTGLQTIVLGAGDEEVSNSIAADEQGGIYIVTSKAMYRVQWTGQQLSVDEAAGAWRTSYDSGTAGTGGGRLGAGSGSTPTIMGSGDQRFVVITDGAQVAKLVLFWADRIPSDWQPIAPGKSLRVAAEMPVDFGDPNRTQTKSEQSVVVSGYGAVVVSNDYSNTTLLGGGTGVPLIDQAMNGAIVLMSGSTRVQPWGVQKFTWDTQSRQLRSAWVNMQVSCPNAIPTVSEASQRFYCVGAYQGAWTMESLDWNSGQGHFRKFIGSLPRFNSFYASTQLTGDGGLIYGTLDGAVYLPAAP